MLKLLVLFALSDSPSYVNLLLLELLLVTFIMGVLYSERDVTSPTNVISRAKYVSPITFKLPSKRVPPLTYKAPSVLLVILLEIVVSIIFNTLSITILPSLLISTFVVSPRLNSAIDDVLVS